MLNKITLAGIAFSILLLSACGSSDSSSQSAGNNGPVYAGVTSQATIDSNNAKTLVIAAADGTNNGDNQEQLNALFSNIANNLQTQSGGITTQATSAGSCGGTATYPDTSNQQQNPVTGTITFSNYCVDTGTQAGQLIISGQVYFSADIQNSQLVSLTIQLTDLVIAFNGNTITTNSTLTFANSTLSFETSTDFAGSQGKTLRIENLVMTGSPDTGIAITSGRIYQPDNGYVDISTAENLVFQGCNIGRPNSGILLLSGSGGSTAQVTFSCATYEVCVNGTATCDIYNW